jgi:hypothetical protein
MANYRESFRFQIRDIEIIESALRNELSRVAALHKTHENAPKQASRARELNQLLAKIYHQKVFYSQVSATGVPGG